jgi:hypothetical protein
MSKHQKMSITLGSIALVLALLSFVLGSAPFTPVMILVFISVPLAIISGYLGSWRLAVITIYFSVASLSVIPMSKELSFRIDYLLVLMGVAGAIIGGVLFYEYKRVTNVT